TAAAHLDAAVEPLRRLDLAQPLAGAVAARGAFAVAVRIVVGPLAVGRSAGAFARARAGGLALPHTVGRTLGPAFAERRRIAATRALHAERSGIASGLDAARIANVLGLTDVVTRFLLLEVGATDTVRPDESEVGVGRLLHDRADLGRGDVAGSRVIVVGDGGVTVAEGAPGVGGAQIKRDLRARLLDRRLHLVADGQKVRRCLHEDAHGGVDGQALVEGDPGLELRAVF